MLHHSIKLLGRTKLPDNPQDGEVVFLRAAHGAYGRGLWLWNGEEWEDASGEDNGPNAGNGRKIEVYTASGVVNKPKMFVATVNLSGLSGGVFNIDYSHVGFTKIHSVQLTGESNGTSLADRRIAGIRKGAVSLTGLSGDLMSATSAGLVASTLLEASEGILHVTVHGE